MCINGSYFVMSSQEYFITLQSFLIIELYRIYELSETINNIRPEIKFIVCTVHLI